MDWLQSELSIATGEGILGFLCALFPICRSITGPGLRDTLAYLSRLLPEMKIHAVPTGTRAFDWVVPDEWTICEGWIEHEDGTRVVDFAEHNLHVVGYSQPVDRWLSHDELQPHLHSLRDQPDAIP